MARYIDADKIQFKYQDGNDEYNRGVESCVREIKSAHTEDVRPVVKGTWIEKKAKDGQRYLQCSVCGKNKMDVTYDDFCKFCGAEMESEGYEMTREERTKLIKHLKYNRSIGSDYSITDKDADEIIKALEQEPYEDAVSRKELLKIYEDRFIELQKMKHLKDNKGDEYRQLGVNYCINILKEIPPVTPTQRWIPVSERLPEDNTKVLVTMYDTYKEKVIVTWYQDKEHGFLCGLVKAWMPLPEPYEAESEYQRQVEQYQYNTLYEPTFDSETGSM